MGRTLRPLAAVAMLTLTVAGCSHGSAGNGSSGAAGSNTAASHTSTAAPREQSVKFAACIRTHGYPDFPDPTASGQFTSFAISVSPAVWDRALLACKALKPPGRLDARLTPVQQSAAIKFARCVRDHGVKDFPDPADDEPLVDAAKIPSTERPGGLSALNAAIRNCRGFVGG